MKIQDLLRKNHILLDVQAGDKSELITTLGRFLASSNDLSFGEAIISRLLEREADMTTGIGYGIAIPHARLDQIDRLYLVSARCNPPVEYESLDDVPVTLLFMMISPQNTSTEHSTILSSISRIVASADIRTRLMEVQSAEEYLAVLVDAENTLL